MLELLAAVIVGTINLIATVAVLFLMSLPFVAVYLIWQFLLG